MGGTVSAPAPDPALVQAQLTSLDSQAELGRRQMAQAEQLAPIQKAQMQFGLDASKTAYDQTQADREYALQKRGQYDQAVQGIVNENDKFDEATRRQELMQQAKADISEQFSQAQEAQQRGLNARGVAPGSGKALLAMQQGELAEAAAKSRAGLMVSEAAKKEGLQLKGQTAQMLAGYPAQAASLTPAGVNLGVMGLDTVNRAGEGMSAGLTAADKAAAAYGSAAADQWSNANNLYTKAQTVNSNAENELIGSGLGLAARGGYSGYKNYGWNGSVFNGSRTGTNQNNTLWG